MEQKTLYVSPAGGSGLRLMNIYECPRKCRFYADGWRLRKVPIYFPYGNLIHKHAERPYKRLDKDGVELPTGEVNPIECEKECAELVETEKTYNPALDMQEDVDVKPKDKDDYPRFARAQMEAWFEKMYEPERVEKCEFRLKTEPMNPGGVEVCEQELADLNFRIVGRLDFIVKHHEDGHLCLRDLKTASSPMKGDFTELDYLFQLSAYRYEWAAMGNPDINDIGAFQLVKRKTKDGVLKHAGEVTYQPMRYDRIFEIIVDGVRRFREYEALNSWPCNPNSCKGKFSPCPFACLCFPEQFENPQEEADKTLVKRTIIK